MRSEEEMYKLFMDIAKADNRILSVYMNGSRTNKNVPKDIFQDYDIVFVVEETEPFINDIFWINNFGNILYMQYPDESVQYPSDKENFYGWLMQFDDGNRVDLHVETVIHAKENILKDKLCKVLLDKKNILPEIPEATDEDYYVKKPSEALFRECVNEFWWCSNNLAKGLWREEMPYVQDMANFVVRKQLEKMLSWKAGIITGFSVSTGKSAKYLYKWIGMEEYQKYLDTYFSGSIKEAWEAVFNMCSLFNSATEYVAGKLGYTYNGKEAKAAEAFLRRVRNLPKDAKEVISRQLMPVHKQSVIPEGKTPEKMQEGIKALYLSDLLGNLSGRLGSYGKKITEEDLSVLMEYIQNKKDLGILLDKEPDLEGDYMQVEISNNLIFLQYIENNLTSDECAYSCFNPDYIDSDEWSPMDAADGQSIILMRYTMDDPELAAKCVEYFVRTEKLYPGMAWLKNWTSYE